MSPIFGRGIMTMNIGGIGVLVVPPIYEMRDMKMDLGRIGGVGGAINT